MIKLTRLDGESFLLNAELIRYVERRPDTYITLTAGDRVMVQESLDQVLERTLAYQRSKFLLAPPTALEALPPARDYVAAVGSGQTVSRAASSRSKAGVSARDPSPALTP